MSWCAGSHSRPMSASRLSSALGCDIQASVSLHCALVVRNPRQNPQQRAFEATGECPATQGLDETTAVCQFCTPSGTASRLQLAVTIGAQRDELATCGPLG